MLSHKTLHNLDTVTTSAISFGHILRAKFICFPTKLCSVCELSHLAITEINWLCQGIGVASESPYLNPVFYLLASQRRLSAEQLMLSNCGAGEDSWESLGWQGDPSYRKSTQNIHWKDWCWSSSTLATWGEEPTHCKRPWGWEILRSGEGDDKGWDGWMASPAQWTWIWANSEKQWRTGKPGRLQSRGSQSCHDLATKEQKQPPSSGSSLVLFPQNTPHPSPKLHSFSVHLLSL